MIHSVTFTGSGTTQTLAAILAASGFYATPAVAGKPDPTSLRPMWIAAVLESGSARIGDVNTSATYGMPVPATAAGGPAFPPNPQMGNTYSFTSIWVYASNGAVVSIDFDA